MSFCAIFLIFAAVLLFLLLIVSHEFGHFLAAKKFGVKVNEFSVGMGPTLFKKQIGETIYSLRALPIGGFCALEGEIDKTKSKKRTLAGLNLFKRSIVIVAGPVMNVVLAIIFMIIVLGQQSQFNSTTVSKMYENTAIYSNDFCTNDKIIEVNGYKTLTLTDISFALAMNPSSTTTAAVIRNNKKVKLDLVEFNKAEDIHFTVKPIKKTFINFFPQVFKEILSIIRITYHSFWLLLTGKLSISNISGPVGIISNVTYAAYNGLKFSFLAALNNIIYIMILLSVNLGLVNLLPFPALDGGRMLLYFIEAIIKRPIKQKTEEIINKIGIYSLIIFAIFITVKDILSLFFRG